MPLEQALAETVGAIQAQVANLAAELWEWKMRAMDAESDLSTIVDYAEGDDHRLLDAAIEGARDLLFSRGWEKCAGCGQTHRPETTGRKCEICEEEDGESSGAPEDTAQETESARSRAEILEVRIPISIYPAGTLGRTARSRRRRRNLGKSRGERRNLQ